MRILPLLLAVAVAGAGQPPPTTQARAAPAPQQSLAGWVSVPTNAALALVGGGEPRTSTSTLVIVQNMASKPITAFSYSFTGGTYKEGAVKTVELLESNPIQPGAKYTLPVSNHELAHPGHTMTIQAVMFEDGSAEGERQAIDYIRAKRLGEILESKRVRDLMHSLDSGTDDASLSRLENQIGALPVSPERALASVRDIRVPGVDAETLDMIAADTFLASAFAFGVHGAREDASLRLKRVQQPPPGERQRGRTQLIAEWKQFEETRAAKQETYLEAASRAKEVRQ